jgi:flagellar biogenesis protein FliO
MPIAPRWQLAVALAASLLAVSSAAEAQEPIRFLGGDIGFDDTRMHVRFDTSGEVGPPRVSSEPGALRVRFADATGDVRLDLLGDGGALRFVRVRPGMGDATVVVIRFPDRRQLSPDALTVERSDNGVDLSLSRSLLGTPRLPEAPAAVAAAAEPAPPAPEPVAEPEAREEAPLIASPAPLFIGSRSSGAPAPSTTPETTERWAQGRTALLLLLTAVSGLGLIVFSWLRSRAGKGSSRLPISVVATHRLSPRQQLVLIRALGQDHLLSIDGQKTERLASTPSPLPEPEQPTDGRTSQPDFSAQLAELLGQPGPSDALRTAALTTPAPTAHAGAMAYAAAPSLAPSLGPSAAGASDAVQGLLRLRARALR